MNKKIFLAIAAFMLPMMAFAQSVSDILHISDLAVNKGDSLFTINMNVNPKDFKVKSNDIVTLTPRFVTEYDTVYMPPIRIAGRKAWFTEIREGVATPFTLSRAGKDIPIEYSNTFGAPQYSPTSSIIIQADTTNICNCDPARSGEYTYVDFNEPPVINDLDFLINFPYVAPNDSADKIFNLSGRANIIFKVNKTDIDWSYFSNKAELDTIVKTIKVVRDNEYATVEKIFLTGYASPEGPYQNNVRLADGRTEEVLKYVERHSDFPHSVYDNNAVPEDWVGLREWIEASDISGKYDMIAFIDDASIPIEKKNDLFKAKFPNEYPFLLNNVYPLLRHTDYKIRYRIKKFYDVNEIEQVFKKNPSLLSLNELYLLSHKYEDGSPEYNDVFITAAAMYPESEVANLNAAGCAMSNGNMQAARRYLEKLSPSADVDCAWGVLYAMEKDYAKAKEYLEKAARAGSQNAKDVLMLVNQALTPVTPMVIH